MTNASVTGLESDKKIRMKSIDELGNVCGVKNDIRNLIEDRLGKSDNRRMDLSSSASYTTVQTEELHSETTTSLTGDTTRELYKMKAYGRRGHKSPTRIEFFVSNSEQFRPSRRTKVKTAKPTVFKKYHCVNSRSGLSFKPDYIRIQSTDEVYPENNGKLHKPNDNADKEVKSVPSASFKDTVKTKLSTTFGGCCEKIRNVESFPRIDSKGINITEEQDTGAYDNLSKPDEQEVRKNIEVYYFDHGNSAYFYTTDYPPHIYSEMLAQQTINHATRFWAEIFGSLHIGVAFIISFFMQGYRFLLYSIVRPILVGLVQMTSDYFIKPFLTIIFNGLLQPVMILFYNIFSSICDMLKPIAELLGHILQPIGRMLGKIRLVEINRMEGGKKFDRINNI